MPKHETLEPLTKYISDQGNLILHGENAIPMIWQYTPGKTELSDPSPEEIAAFATQEQLKYPQLTREEIQKYFSSHYNNFSLEITAAPFRKACLDAFQQSKDNRELLYGNENVAFSFGTMFSERRIWGQFFYFRNFLLHISHFSFQPLSYSLYFINKETQECIEFAREYHTPGKAISPGSKESLQYITAIPFDPDYLNEQTAGNLSHILLTKGIPNYLSDLEKDYYTKTESLRKKLIDCITEPTLAKIADVIKSYSEHTQFLITKDIDTHHITAKELQRLYDENYQKQLTFLNLKVNDYNQQKVPSKSIFSSITSFFSSAPSQPSQRHLELASLDQPIQIKSKNATELLEQFRGTNFKDAQQVAAIRKEIGWLKNKHPEMEEILGDFENAVDKITDPKINTQTVTTETITQRSNSIDQLKEQIRNNLSQAAKMLTPSLSDQQRKELAEYTKKYWTDKNDPQLKKFLDRLDINTKIPSISHSTFTTFSSPSSPKTELNKTFTLSDTDDDADSQALKKQLQSEQPSQEVIAKLLGEVTTLTLNFKDPSITKKGYEGLLTALQQNTLLRSLNFSGRLSLTGLLNPYTMQIAVESLEKNFSLTSIGISDNDYFDDEIGMNCLTKALSTSSVTSLNLINENFSQNRNIIPTLITTAKKLTSLNFSNSSELFKPGDKLNNTIFQALAEHSSLEKLDLSGITYNFSKQTRLSTEKIEWGKNPQLFGDSLAIGLISILRTNTSLKSIKFGTKSGGFSAKTLNNVLNALEKNLTITHFELTSDNQKSSFSVKQQQRLEGILARNAHKPLEYETSSSSSSLISTPR